MNQNLIKTIFFNLKVHILINVIFFVKLGGTFRKYRGPNVALRCSLPMAELDCLFLSKINY